SGASRRKPWWQRGRGGRGSPSGSGRAAWPRRATWRPPLQRKRDPGDRGRGDPGEQVGCLIGGKERRDVNDAGFLLFRPGHRLKEANARLDAGVEEELERDGEEVQG